MKNFKRKESLKEAGIITVDEHCVLHSKQNIQQAGITLLALVVTIIVLLILAGVTLTLALSNNGVMYRAQYASNTWANATKDETAMMGELGQRIDDLSNVNSGGGSTGTTIKIGDTDLSTAVANLKTNEALKDYYGQTTDFTSVAGVTWDLFYDDADNYYLIASDYVPVSTLPSELNKESGEATQKYKAWFATYSNSTYSGPIMDNTPWSNGTGSNTITENPLTNKYLKWVNSSQVSTTNNPNMKAVAYMMDTSKWSDFAGGVEGAYAIGGPTIEMFVNSYNAVSSHTTKLGTYGTSASDITSENANSNGYKVKMGTGSWGSYGCEGLDTSGTGGNSWVRTGTDKAYAYWLASPLSGYNTGVMRVYYNGNDGEVGRQRRELPRLWIPPCSFNSKIVSRG